MKEARKDEAYITLVFCCRSDAGRHSLSFYGGRGSGKMYDGYILASLRRYVIVERSRVTDVVRMWVCKLYLDVDNGLFSPLSLQACFVGYRKDALKTVSIWVFTIVGKKDTI